MQHLWEKVKWINKTQELIVNSLLDYAKDYAKRHVEENNEVKEMEGVEEEISKNLFLNLLERIGFENKFKILLNPFKHKIQDLVSNEEIILNLIELKFLK